jgi:hypothetical protein
MNYTNKKISKGKMKKLLLALLCCVTLLVCSTQADTLTLGSSSGIPTYDGHYVGFIPATINPGNFETGIICDDINHTSYFNSSWEVNIKSLVIPPNTSVSGTMFSPMLKYEQAAWLMTQIDPVSYPGNTGPIQEAIWKVMTPDYTITSAALIWFNQALGVDFTKYKLITVDIYTPAGRCNTNQEFLGGAFLIKKDDTLPPAVPIPPSAFLLGSGLLGMGLLRLRKEG